MRWTVAATLDGFPRLLLSTLSLSPLVWVGQAEKICHKNLCIMDGCFPLVLLPSQIVVPESHLIYMGWESALISYNLGELCLKFRLNQEVVFFRKGKFIITPHLFPFFYFCFCHIPGCAQVLLWFCAIGSLLRMHRVSGIEFGSIGCKSSALSPVRLSF